MRAKRAKDWAIGRQKPESAAIVRDRTTARAIALHGFVLLLALLVRACLIHG